jgi:V/A-type H+-transporting ATPase subunit I
MRWRDELLPTPMRRVAVVAPESRFRRVLVELADAGTFEPDPPRAPGPIAALAARARAGGADVGAQLSLDPVDPERLASAGNLELLLGEASLEEHSSASESAGRCRVLPGWMRDLQVEDLRERIAPLGGAVAELPGRRGLVPPTAHAERTAGTTLRPLVSTYATVPYRDIDPTLFAALAYVVMFGMMFGDVAHGLAIVVVGVAARRAQGGRLRAVHGVAPFLIGAGAAAVGFGFLYGEAFGPTGLVPTLWFRPLDEPERLLIVGLVFGGVLMTVTFLMAIVNRWRENGPSVALYDASGVGGALLLVGAAGLVLGVAQSVGWAMWAGIGMTAIGATLVFVGLIVHAGPGASGLAEAAVEMFDTVLRLGSNVVSFTRLAAFGLTHAVITTVVWDGTVGLWDGAALLDRAAAIALFAAGNAAGFALGALVGAVQALRLEYYELFSRLFTSSGRPFDPWHVPARREPTPPTATRVTPRPTSRLESS